MDVIEKLRLLARNNYYQSLFSLGKEHSDLKIFENDIDFSQLQMLFLRYLSFYSAIYTDIALGDVSDIVLETDIRCDAYIMYKNKMEKDKLNNKSKNNLNSKTETIGGSRWLFKSKKNEKFSKEG